MPTNENEGREGIELMPSGAIRIWIDGTEYKLRRPRVRDFRTLREAMQDATDEITAAANEAQRRQIELQDAIKARGDDAEQTDEERIAIRQIGRDLTLRREDLMLTWWAQVGERLCERTGWPDVDDMATWMGTTESATELVTHWRSVPSLSGVR